MDFQLTVERQTNLQRERERRAYEKAQTRNRRWTKSNVKWARRPEGWREWIAWLRGARFRHHAYPLPAHLRTHVPHVRATLRAGGPEADALWEDIKRHSTAIQWSGIVA